MRKVVFAINITADGFLGHTSVVADVELHEYFTRLLGNAGLLVYGRKAYELMVPYWPDVFRDPTAADSEIAFARVFVSIDKVVFSTTLAQAGEANARIVRGNLAGEVKALKELAGKDIYIGSPGIASQLAVHGLIDEYIFVVHPVLAGRGPRLFEAADLQKTVQLELLGSERFRSGAMAMKYGKQ
jgi:dihydrofolate reductase